MLDFRCLLAVSALLCAALLTAYAQPDCAVENVWVDSRRGSPAGNGSLNDPFLDLRPVANLLESTRPDPSCVTSVHMSPGTYNFSSFEALHSFEFQRCFTCPGGSQGHGDVLIIVQPDQFLTTGHPTIAKFSNVSFLGESYANFIASSLDQHSTSPIVGHSQNWAFSTFQGPSSPPSSRKSRAEAAFNPFRNRPFMDIFGESVFDGVHFLGLSRENHILKTRFLRVSITRSLFIHNTLWLTDHFPPSEYTYSLSALYSFKGFLTIHNSTFARNTLKVLPELQNPVSGGQVRLEFGGTLTISNSTFVSNNIELLSTPLSSFQENTEDRIELPQPEQATPPSSAVVARRVFGAAIAVDGAKLYMTYSLVSNNSIKLDPDLERNFTTFGAGIGLDGLFFANITGSSITHNHANYGAGIGYLSSKNIEKGEKAVVGEVSARKMAGLKLDTDNSFSPGLDASIGSEFDSNSSKLYVGSSDFNNNVCELGGCALYVSSLSSVHVALSHLRIFDNLLSTSDYCEEKYPSQKLRASALAVVASNSPGRAPAPTSFTLTDSLVRQNHIESLLSCYGSSVAVLEMSQVSDVTLDGVRFDSIDSTIRGRTSDIVIIRKSSHVSLLRVVVYNSTILTGSAFDIQDDLRILGDTTQSAPSVLIKDCDIRISKALSIINIANVESVVLDKIRHYTDPNFNITQDSKVLQIASVFSSVFINGWSSNTAKTPISVGFTPLLVVQNTWISSYRSDFGLPSFSITSVNNATFVDTEWTSSYPTALLASTTSLWILRCRFSATKGGDKMPGSILLSSGHLDIVGSEFVSNEGYSGGAISINGNLVIKDSLFRDNQATTGGAISVLAGHFSISRLRCLQNTAYATGGCLYVWSPSSRSLNGASRGGIVDASIFSKNTAQTGGAFAASEYVQTLWINNTFNNNRAQDSGGALHLTGGRHQMREGAFFYNRAGPPSLGGGQDAYERPLGEPRPSRPMGSSELLMAGRGGAIYAKSSWLTVYQTKFDECLSRRYGGAIYLSSVRDSSQIRIERTNFTRNSALIAGGAITMISAENEGMCDTFLDTAFFDSNNASYGGAIHYSSMVPCTGVIPPPGTSIPETGIFGFRYDLVLLKDTSFLNNQAVISGGAVYFAGITNAYFEYEGLTLQDNKAAVSGSHFFFNPLPVNDAIEHSAPNFCNSSRCHITSTTSTVLDHRKGAGVVGIQPLSSKPQWGSLWASSGLWPTVSILSGSDFDVIVPFNPKVDNGSLTAFPGDWRVVIAFRDLYDQLCSQSIWLDPDLTFRGNDSGFDCGEAICPWNVSSSRGYGFLSLGITLRHSFLQAYPPDVFDPKIANPYEHPLQIKGSLRFKSLPSADPSALSEASVELNLIIKGCPVGFGLTPSPGDPIMMSCQPCPLNTYNLDGNGQCYACGRGDSEYAICEGSLIQSQPGYWATNVNKTNQLFVSECPLGFCVSPSCAHGRTGAMCSECVDGMFESLFPFCSAHLCSKPNVSFLLLLGIVAAILFPLMVHIAIFRWPDETRHVLNIAFLTLLILQPLFDWAIPLSARRLAEFICGFRATPLQRLYFLALVPYASFVGLWATFAVERLIATLASLFSTSSTWTIAGLHQTGSIFDIKRFALTSGAILYLVGVQPLKFALDLSLCSITPFGQVWLIHPSVNCESKSFRISETVMWILVALLTLVPHLATLGFWIFTTIKRRAASKQTEYQFFLLIPSKGTIENYGSHTRLESTKDGLVVSNADLLLEAEFESIEPIQQAFFFIARGKSLLWPFVEMATRVAIPFICSLTLFHPNIRSALLASVFLIAMGFNSVASPFESLLPRLTASGSWAVLALLSIWLVELQSDPRFTLAVFSLSPVFIVTLVILFAWANRTAKKSEPSGSSNSPSSFMSPTQRMDQVETTHTLTEEEAPASACSSLVQEQDPDRSQSL